MQMPTTTDRLAPATAAHRPEMQALFEKVFGHPLSDEEWHWKYVTGGGCGVGLWHGDDLVAHYGGLPRRVLFQGREALACQVCDVMVDSRARRALARRGPLYQITANFLETQIGHGLPHLIGFGFPTDRHHLAAERLGLYAAVDQMDCASWPAQGSADTSPLRVQAITEAELVAGSPVARMVDDLWSAMHQALPEHTVGIRDAPWLLHRYLRHPRFRYRLLLVRSRWLRRPVGVVVLRQHAEHLEWVDAVAPPQAWKSLLAVVRSEAVSLGLPRVEAWITRSQKALLDSVAADAAWRPLGIDVPANVHTPGPSVEQLRGRWLLMAGDTDFR